MNLLQGLVEGFAYLIRTVGFEQLNWKGSMSKLDGLLTGDLSSFPLWAQHYVQFELFIEGVCVCVFFSGHNLLGWKN